MYTRFASRNYENLLESRREPENQKSENSWYEKPDMLEWLQKTLATNERIRLLFVMGGFRKNVFLVVNMTIIENKKVVQCTTENKTMKISAWKKYLAQLPKTTRLFNNYLAWHSLSMRESYPKSAYIDEELFFNICLLHDGNKVDDVVLSYKVDLGFVYLEENRKPNKIERNRLIWKWKTLEDNVSITIKLRVNKRGLLNNSANLRCLQCPTQRFMSITKVNRLKNYSLSIKGPVCMYIFFQNI